MLNVISSFSARSRKVIKQTSKNIRNRLLSPEKLVQAGKTSFQVLYQEDIVTLRYYPALRESDTVVDGNKTNVELNTHPIPLVIVPPLGVNMTIYDLFQERSLVRYLRTNGFELYLIDWGSPGYDQNHYTLETYFADKMPRLLSLVRSHSGQTKLSLHGWSLGALFSICYAGLGDPDIENMVLIGAPFDSHVEGLVGKQIQRLEKICSLVKRSTGWEIHNSPKAIWRSPGILNTIGFKFISPGASVRSYVGLLMNLYDEEYVAKHATLGAFLDHMLAYPGGVSQDLIHYFCNKNVMANGGLPMNSGKDKIKPLTANMILVCGKNDTIVTRDNSIGLLDFVKNQTTTHTPDMTVLDVNGGHMGILSGARAPVEIWPLVIDWLADRSSLSEASEMKTAV